MAWHLPGISLWSPLHSLPYLAMSQSSFLGWYTAWCGHELCCSFLCQAKLCLQVGNTPFCCYSYITTNYSYCLFPMCQVPKRDQKLWTLSATFIQFWRVLKRHSIHWTLDYCHKLHFNHIIYIYIILFFLLIVICLKNFISLCNMV